MLFSTIRRNKANILYFIITVSCLEHVRVRHNRLEDAARKENWNNDFLRHRQDLLVVKAGMVYAIFLSLVILNAISVLTTINTSVYSGTDFLRTGIALGIELILSYLISVIIIRILIYQYIKLMNGLTVFWKKLGRSAWDGAKIVIQTPGRVGIAVKDTVYKGAKIGVKTVGDIKCGLSSAAKKTTTFISKIFRKK